MKIKVPIIKQKHKMGCGAAGMSMVYSYFGKDVAVLFEKKEDLRIGHFIILTGYERNKFYYNDPYGENKIISDDKLIFALSNNVFDSSAYLLVIRK